MKPQDLIVKDTFSEQLDARFLVEKAAIKEASLFVEEASIILLQEHDQKRARLTFGAVVRYYGPNSLIPWHISTSLIATQKKHTEEEMTSALPEQKTQLRSIYEQSMLGGNKFTLFSTTSPVKEEISASPVLPSTATSLDPATTNSASTGVEVSQCTLSQLFVSLNEEIHQRWPNNQVGMRFVQTHDSKEKWFENKHELKTKAKLKLKEAKRKQQQQAEELAAAQTMQHKSKRTKRTTIPPVED